MKTHKQFLDKWVGGRYRENPKFGYQCVALDKKYCEEVYGIKGLSFGGSAINGWNRKGNLDNYFDRVDYPRQGDLVFFSDTPTNEAGHTAIHNDDYSILEQNGGIGGGTGLGVDAIRLHKAPSNALGFMRPKPISMTHFLQENQPDCSLLATINCYCANNGNDARSFTQEVVDKLMPEYYGKTTHEAFLFLKSKGYNIKYLQLDFKGARRRLDSGSAVTLHIKPTNLLRGHATCCKKIDGKYHIIDSTTPMVNILNDIDIAFANGIFSDHCSQIK